MGTTGTPLSSESIKKTILSFGAEILENEWDDAISFVYNGYCYKIFLNRNSIVTTTLQMSVTEENPIALKKSVEMTDMESSMCRVQEGSVFGEIEIVLSSLGSSLEHFIYTFEKSLVAILSTRKLLINNYKEITGLPLAVLDNECNVLK